MSNSHTKLLSVPLKIGVTSICDDPAMARVLKVCDDTKVMDSVAGFIVIDVVNRPTGVFTVDDFPCDPMGSILSSTNLDLHVVVPSRDCSSPIANGHTNSRFHLPVKPTGYNTVIEKMFDVVRYLFHTRIIPLIG